MRRHRRDRRALTADNGIDHERLLQKWFLAVQESSHRISQRFLCFIDLLVWNAIYSIKRMLNQRIASHWPAGVRCWSSMDSLSAPACRSTWTTDRDNAEHATWSGVWFLNEGHGWLSTEQKNKTSTYCFDASNRDPTWMRFLLLQEKFTDGWSIKECTVMKAVHLHPRTPSR